jgi:hypothetical protein
VKDVLSVGATIVSDRENNNWEEWKTMKRAMSLALVVVLVLAFGAITHAAEGPLNSGDKLTATLNTQAEIGQYAQIEQIRDLQFGVLEGKVGVYTASKEGSDSFYTGVLTKFGVEPGKLIRKPDDGRGSFELETNCDVKVSLAFSSDKWLASKTLFAITQGDECKTWAGRNIGLGSLPTVFALGFQRDTRHVFHVDGAIYIESISQQLADNYNGTLTVTVEAD